MRQGVAHLTSVHPRYDTRIFVKECSSLSGEGYDVTLIVADGRGDEVKNGIDIVDVGKAGGRVSRMVSIVYRIYRYAVETDAEICHLHDPELLWIAPLLKRHGKRVVYDSHEDLPKLVMAKYYIPSSVRRVLARFAEIVEGIFVSSVDAVVSPTPSITKRFERMGKRVSQVANYPSLAEISGDFPWEKRGRSVCYIGAIARSRGIEEMVEAIGGTDIVLELGGDFRPASLRDEISGLPGWANVKEHGYIGRDEVVEILGRSKIGLVVLHPLESYRESIPVKMFEYFAAGMPVIASDFPFWRDMLDGCECIRFVDPSDVDGLKKAIEEILDDDEKARIMGENGAEIVKERFNWDIEFSNLIECYEKISERADA